MTTLKHTWWKKGKFPMQVTLHIDDDNDTYWIEVNGCQETSIMTIPNIGKEGACKWWGDN